MCTIKKFDSADFGKTTPTISVTLPQKLKHENVQKHKDNVFSTERKHPVYFVDLPSHAIGVVISDLAPGGHSNRHRHTYETIIYILEGKGYSLIENMRVEWQKGDAIYIPVWAWHHHINQDSENIVKYLACENAPMLQNMGIAIREEDNLTIGDTYDICTA